MFVLSRSVAVVLIALLTASVFSFTPLFVSAVDAPVAAADSFNGTEGVSLMVPAPGVLTNDDDGDGGGFMPLTAVTLMDPPSIPGVFSLGNDGSVSFTPTDPEFNGDVTFTYTVTDDETFTSAPATVTMTIDPVNDAPVANNQSIDVIKNVASSSVLNATDIDAGAIITYGVTVEPAHGTVTVQTATGEFTYTPDTDSVVSDSFTWQAHDGTASSSDGVVTINMVEAENSLALCSNGTNNDGDADTDLEDADCVSFIPEIGISVVIVNDNSGTATTADIELVFDSATTSGATTSSSVGAHSVGATSLSGYDRTIGGDCAADGTITLAAGDSRHCVVSYDDTSAGGGTPAPGIEEKKQANGPISDIGPFFGTISNFSGLVLGAATTSATSSLPELPAGCTPMLSGFLRKENMQNDPEQVKKLQQFLSDKIEGTVPLTGEFGPATDAAVRAFQLKYADQILNPWGIQSPTGFVYLTTQRWINLMSCSTLDIPMPKLVPYHHR